MPGGHDQRADGSAKQLHGKASSSGERQMRRKRLTLSCSECKKKKLSCDRNLPCQRCIRSGRPDECSFDTGTGQPPVPNKSALQQQAQNHNDEIKALRAEVVRLKDLLSKTTGEGKSDHIEASWTEDDHFSSAAVPNGNAEGDWRMPNIHDHEFLDPQERFPRGYYGQHNTFRLFGEVLDLFPFIKETTHEWLHPLGVRLKKGKLPRDVWTAEAHLQRGGSLETLLPTKDETDTLITFYLDHFEQLHRIVHIPTFRKEYANFWTPGRNRYAATTALILSMMSVSTYALFSSRSSTPVQSTCVTMPLKWIPACEQWVRQQSTKHRKLVHYQIACLVYLARRVHMIGKKQFWNDTGSLVRNAIMDGFNRDSEMTRDSPYMREMKRRIWNVIRELDLQNTYEHTLPTLLQSVESDGVAPANLDDEDFDETSKELPMSKPPNQYTHTAYQFHSSRSWKLRLEISRRLFNTGAADSLSYEDALSYTHELTQAINSLPPWNTEDTDDEGESRFPALVYALLHFQLKECVLALHEPYLRKRNNSFWVSENICYHMSCDILLVHRRLARSGIRSLMLLRGDLLLAALNLTRITLLQPKGSFNVITTNSEHTIDLLEQCLPYVEHKYLYSALSEPWCFMTLYGAIVLLKIHAGKESRHKAKALCAQKFLELYHKRANMQPMSVQSQQPTTSRDTMGVADTFAMVEAQNMPDTTTFPASWWLDSNYSDLGIDPFDLDMDFGSTWED